MSDDPNSGNKKPGDEKPEELAQRVYPEDERLREIEENADRRMTRAEWEREESRAREAAHKKHQQVRHDREVQQEYDKRKKKPHRNWKKILLWGAVALAVVLAIFLVGYIPHREREKRAAALAREREQEEPQVEVIQARRTTAPGELTVPATTTSLTEAYIYARANGYLRKRYVDIGDHVKKGQLLALIDAPDLDQQVEQAREQLNQAVAQVAQQQATLNLNRVTWERWRTLVAKGVFSRQDGDQREANYLSQEAVVASAQRNVESYRANLARMIALQSYERITAPFDGIVTQRNTDIGALVGTSGAASAAPMESPQSPSGGSASVGTASTSGTSGTPNQAASPSTGEAQGGPIFAVAQIDTLRILVAVPEGYAQSVRKGMQAKVFLQERPNKPIMGTVTRTADSLDQNTRTMLTEVDVPNHDGSLYPGMYAVVTFVQVRGVAPLTIPGDAVVVRGDRNTVAIVRNEKIQMVPVEIGRDYGPSVEILGGLREGDWVVTTVTDSVREGVKVRPKQTQQPGQDTGQGGNQQQQAPDSGPDQYGDQSIVNAQSESSTQQGKSGQKGGQQQGQSNSGKKGGSQ
jgi:multidrug efflux pump subunit AcrA (membrane-fusion protein)